MAWEDASCQSFAHQTFGRQTFGTNVKCKTHLFWAAHLQNVPVQNVECKVCCKRLAALAFSPNVLQNRVFNYRRKTTDTIKHTEAKNVTSHFAARMSRVETRA